MARSGDLHTRGAERTEKGEKKRDLKEESFVRSHRHGSRNTERKYRENGTTSPKEEGTTERVERTKLVHRHTTPKKSDSIAGIGGESAKRPGWGKGSLGKKGIFEAYQHGGGEEMAFFRMLWRDRAQGT